MQSLVVKDADVSLADIRLTDAVLWAGGCQACLPCTTVCASQPPRVDAPSLVTSSPANKAALAGELRWPLRPRLSRLVSSHF